MLNISRKARFVVSKMKFIFCCLFISAICLQATNAQSIVVTGTISDDVGPIAGANIIVKGTTIGIVTDANGRFSLNVPSKESVLQFSFVGYATQEFTVRDQTVFNIQLVEDTRSIEEVVVVGYGVQKKEHVIGSVTQVAGAELAAIQASDVTNAISGRLAGTSIMMTTGEPGRTDAKIRVRGRTTLGTENEKTAPLVVIDGIPGRSMNEIDPNDIASISVLKDAAASIYGSTAANGVILITTKKGTTEKTQLSYQFYQGFVQPTVIPKMANAADYAQYISDWQTYQGQERLYSDRDIELFKSGQDPWEHPDTDWMDILIRDWNTTTRHNLSLSGSTKSKMTYYASLGYRDEEAIYSKTSTKIKQYNMRINLDMPVTDWLKTSINYAGFRTGRKFPVASTATLYGWATIMVPGSHAYYPTGEPGPPIESGINPVVNTGFEAGYDEYSNYINQISLAATIDIPMIEGLSFTGRYAYDVNNQFRKLFKTPWTLYRADYANATRNSEGFVTSANVIPEQVGLVAPELTEYTDRKDRSLWIVNFDYNRTFGDHSISLFGAFEQLEDNNSDYQAYRRWFVSDYVQMLNAGGDVDKSNEGKMSIYARQSWIGRFNYNYKEKYMAEILFRRDGSLKFPKSGRWGNFPGFLLGWRASEEAFWKENISFVNYFKLRTSYGLIGMDPGDPFQYINKYALGTGITLGDDKQVQTKINQSTIANPNITWEKQSTYNLGFDSQFSNNLFFLNFDLFFSRRTDILAQRNASVPEYTGLSLPSENIAEVKNKGFEIEAGTHFTLFGDLKVDVSGNISWNRNKVVYQDEPARVVPWQVTTGRAFGEALVFESIGIFKDQAAVDNYPHWNGAKPGDVIFRDVSGDGQINNDDRVYLKNSEAPEVFYGFKIDAAYKNWSLNILLQGQGKWLRNTISQNRGVGQNFYDWMVHDYWTPNNSNASQARAFHRQDVYWSYIARSSTYWFDNQAFLRLRNVNLNYTIPNRITEVVGISNATITLSGNNLFFLYRGHKKYDPEVGDPEIYPTVRTLSAGLRVNF